LPATPPVVDGPAATVPPVAIASTPPQPPESRDLQVFEYELRDRLLGGVRKVVWRQGRADGDAGEFSLAMPPGGWIPREPRLGDEWTLAYRPAGNAAIMDMKLRARVLGEATQRVGERELRTVQVEFAGQTERGISAFPTNPGVYRAVAWYAPELGRVVRFEVRTRGGIGASTFFLDEQLVLVAIRAE
ncbi:MAG TPA: hypothetical protein VNB23_15035, partial [Ramlibacter sp.]|nr:hypothetical protein [Ramlibacter sp.]